MCYQLLLRSTELEAEGQSSTNEDVIASLLADLQEVQDHELESVTQGIHSMVCNFIRIFYGLMLSHNSIL